MIPEIWHPRTFLPNSTMLRAVCCPFIVSRVVWSHSGITAHAALGAEDSGMGLSESSNPINQMLALSVCYLELLIILPGILPPQLPSQHADASQRAPADCRYLFCHAFVFALPTLTEDFPLHLCGSLCLQLRTSPALCFAYTFSPLAPSPLVSMPIFSTHG